MRTVSLSKCFWTQLYVHKLFASIRTHTRAKRFHSAIFSCYSDTLLGREGEQQAASSQVFSFLTVSGSAAATSKAAVMSCLPAASSSTEGMWRSVEALMSPVSMVVPGQLHQEMSGRLHCFSVPEHFSFVVFQPGASPQGTVRGFALLGLLPVTKLKILDLMHSQTLLFEITCHLKTDNDSWKKHGSRCGHACTHHKLVMLPY